MTLICSLVVITPFVIYLFIDHETARFLRGVMPDILERFNEADIADQLLQARQKLMRISNQHDGAVSLEDRVAEAITTLVSGR